jgi:uncharacterized protein (TIGR02246 family)
MREDDDFISSFARDGVMLTCQTSLLGAGSLSIALSLFGECQLNVEEEELIMDGFGKIAVILSLLLIWPVVSLANGSENVRAAIEEVNTQFAAAFNRGDTAAVASFYTEDGSLLPPGEAIVSGRSNIEAYWKAGVGAGLSNLQLRAAEVESQGEMAYEVGEFSFDMPTSDGGKATEKGKYLVVWKNIDGSWKLHRDIWNDPPKQ